MTPIPVRILSIFILCLLAARSVADDRKFTNSLGMTMVRIEPGSFEMGGLESETVIPSDQWDETPRHRVTIARPFSMAATEVTNGQYEQFDPEHWKHRGLRGVSRADDKAVTFVSWHDAQRMLRDGGEPTEDRITLA